LELRRHLLKLYALVAILVIVVNEALLLVDAPLNARVTTFALLPIALHFLFSNTPAY
jgi:E3 ubiquitin-protein ligase DOA10